MTPAETRAPGTRPPADLDARERIATDLASTLFVEAGAGSGKTASLVRRVVAIVLDEGIPLRNVAAVTFTEKAGAELRDRLRAEFEKARRQAADAGDETRASAAEQALDDVDTAAIGTLHSFAQRLLGEHPIEARLPPLVEVSDEVASQVAAEDRWMADRAALLEDENLKDTVVLGLSAGMKLDHLRSVATEFNREWDRLGPAVLAAGEPAVPRPDVARLLAEGRDLLREERHCLEASDRFAAHFRLLNEWLDRLEEAGDDAAALQVLGDLPRSNWSNGRRANWSCDLEDLRARGRKLYADAEAEKSVVMEGVLRRLGYRLAQDTLAAAEERRREGRLEFHDLLVLARDLLRHPTHGGDVRQKLHDRYQRLLLDEFQDTDPIQIELAVRIAGGRAADAPDWRAVKVPDGRLFVVGDPKQSIYRFRRADIRTYLQAQHAIGRRVELTANFRSTPPILDWVNAVFATLIQKEQHSQPPYVPLTRNRADAPGGSRVLLLGTTPLQDMNADAMREREAAEVARAIALAVDEKWQVADRNGSADADGWRPVRLGDIAILVPARTSLPQLEDALDRAGISYRAEASSLVYRTAEVRDLLMTARAIDDPSDALALVSALRSPLFGCGDDDLWTWKAARGSFNLLARPPDAVPVQHPVRRAVEYLQELLRARRWLAPADVLDRIVRERRMLEVGADGPRARDVWRRLRFVVDHARAWSEAETGGLRAYLAWARRQGEETSRVAESVLPETDSDAVRILTIHSAKGLEFPVVVLSGMSSQATGRRGVQILWRPDGYALRLNSTLETGDFSAAKPLDEQMDDHERRRLLYVACTRARDHLIVSVHRKERKGGKPTNAQLLAEATEGSPYAAAIDPDYRPPLPGPQPGARVPPAPPYDEWLAGVTASRQAAARVGAVSASSLEGTMPASPRADTTPDGKDAGLAKDARDLELPPWNKGRYGTAIGRAVHGVLQMVDLGTGAGLAEAVAAQALAEGVADAADIVGQLCRSALDSEVVQRAAARRHWRETYVGTPRPDGTLLEGFIDLVYREDDGSLVIVDYKTDAAPGPALDARVAVYRPQMLAYGDALRAATGEEANVAQLLFLAPSGSTAREVRLS